MLWAKKVLESIKVAYRRNILANIFNTSTRLGDEFSIGTSNFVFEDMSFQLEHQTLSLKIQHGVLRCCKESTTFC